MLGFDHLHHAECYRRYGFGLVRSVFSPSEIPMLRSTIESLSSTAGGECADLMSYRELWPVLLDGRVLSLVREALGPRIVYFGDSTFVTYDRDRQLHRDARRDNVDPSNTPYPIIRLGIYLQDHAEHSEGLKLMPGSHHTVFWKWKNVSRLVRGELSPRAFAGVRRYHNVPTRAGDLVYWNLRVAHSGRFMRLKMFPNLPLSPSLENRLPDILKRPREYQRYAMFCSLGAPSLQLDDYIDHISQTERGQRNFTFDNPELLSLCASRGLEVRTDFIDRQKRRQEGMARAV